MDLLNASSGRSMIVLCSKLALDRASAASAFGAAERRELRMRGERERVLIGHQEKLCVCVCVSVNLVNQIP